MPDDAIVAWRRDETAGAGQAATLRSERDRFVALAFTWGEILFELDSHRRIAFAAGLTGSILGLEPDELIGRRFEHLVDDDDQRQLSAELDKARDRGRIGPLMIKLQCRDDDSKVLELSGYYLSDRPARFFLALRACSVAADGGAKDRCEVDGLFTASAFAELAKQRLSDGPAGRDKRMTLIAVPGMDDLVGRFDSQRGHELLGLVADVLRGHADGGDAAARLADGKYGLVHAADLDLAELRTKLSDAMRDSVPVGEGREIGTATMSAEEGLAEEDLAKGLVYAINSFQRSQRIDFTVKHLNRNLGSLVREATTDLGTMKRIIRESRFDLAFQPIVAIDGRALHHFEVLSRFHANPGESPYRYIAFAEEIGLIVGFDLAVVRKTLAWLDQHLDLAYPVAVNISGQSITDPRFRESFLGMLHDCRSSPRRLMVEMTESARVSDLAAANGLIQEIRKAGCKVCLDDFGAGAASFHYLTMLEVDIVKVDGPALRHCLTAPKGEAILSALTRMCEKVGIECVAEMIDSEEMLAFARRCGFVYAQGYYFGKPTPDVACHLPAAVSAV